MKPVYRLRKKSQFNYAYKKGKSYACKNLVLVYAKSNADKLKAGFSVSKKIGKSVTRNRIKRRLKEAFSEHIQLLKQGYYYVFIARAAIANDDYKKISSSVKYLLKKADLFVR